MRKYVWMISVLALGMTALAQRPVLSPPQQTSATFGGKEVTIKYSAPSVKGRKIFGDGGLISKDPTYPVWRAGANSATALHTDADLDIGGVSVPKGDYTLFVQVDQMPWQLIINKQTGQWGLSYDKGQDVGRAKMTMSRPASLVETYKMTLSSKGNAGKLMLEWENTSASVDVKAK